MLVRGAILACLAALPLTLAQASAESTTASTSASGSSLSALAALPVCAQKCFVSAIARSTCEPTDTLCLCTNATLQQDIQVCVGKTCTVKQALATKNATMTQCHAPVRNQHTEFVVSNAVMGIFSAIFALQRLITKFCWKLPFGLDDLFMIPVMVLAVPCILINHYGLGHNGMGRDIWTLKPEQITNFGMFFYVMAVLYFALQCFLKLTMLFFYLRIFPTKNVRRLLWGTVAFTSTFSLVYVLIAIFQCKPINYFWRKWDGEHTGTCMDVNAITWSNAVINIALDFWILVIPLSQLKKMNLDWKKKIGVGMMFGVGIFVTIMSILRLTAVIKAGTGKTGNSTWEYVAVSKWSTIELNVAIMCACLPSLRVLLVRLFPKILGTSLRSGYYNYGSNKPTTGNTHKSESRSQSAYVTSQRGDTHRQRVDPNGITIDRRYDVEFGESDETYLVHMKDIDNKSAGSEVRSTISR
ncbi:hypothetical protein FGRMN_1183 [Fusarium graminum]|nr:hypothetical protein FGRMN_1183 [Fusarium graminum]